jgi:hypothetical protein
LLMLYLRHFYYVNIVPSANSEYLINNQHNKMIY